MQALSEPDVAGVLNRIVRTELPGRRGLGAWRGLLKAHATLMRHSQLISKTRQVWPWATSTFWPAWRKPAGRCG